MDECIIIGENKLVNSPPENDHLMGPTVAKVIPSLSFLSLPFSHSHLHTNSSLDENSHRFSIHLPKTHTFTY